MAPVRCPLCGAENASCGGQRAHSVGVTIGRAASAVGKLNTYDVEINGVQTTIKLTEEQAKARGLVSDKKAAASADKKVKGK